MLCPMSIRSVCFAVRQQARTRQSAQSLPETLAGSHRMPAVDGYGRGAENVFSESGIRAASYDILQRRWCRAMLSWL